MNKTIEYMLHQADKGRLVNASDFLNEVYSGAPIDDVKFLLDSENEFLASEGAWVLSEVGAAARHLISVFPKMATHSNFRVRFWSVDYALLVLCVEDTEYVPYVLKLLTDEDLRVRCHAIILFRHLDVEIFCNFTKSKTIDLRDMKYLDLSYLVCNYGNSEIKAGILSNEIGVRSISIMQAIKDKELLLFVKNLSPEDINDELAGVLDHPQFSAN